MYMCIYTYIYITHVYTYKHVHKTNIPKPKHKNIKPYRKRKADITAGMKSMLRETRN